jgi:aryl-alcohol dehydrogenase
METKMKIQALVVERKDAPFELQEIELGQAGRGEALVRIVAAGVCHTDAITRAGDMPMPFPSVLGHEGAGIVEEVGPGVTQIAPGDQVIIGWPSCGECPNCLDGQPRYCLRTGDALVSGRRFKGELKGQTAYSRKGKPLNGHFFGQSSFATYSITSADALVKVADGVPLELLGPLACGLATGAGAVLNEARPRLGDSALIVGVGASALLRSWRPATPGSLASSRQTCTTTVSSSPRSSEPPTSSTRARWTWSQACTGSPGRKLTLRSTVRA